MLMRSTIQIVRLFPLALAALFLATVVSAADDRPVKCASAPVAVRGTTDGIDVFVVGSDKQAYQAIYDGKAWSWTNLGGICYHGIAATRTPTGRIDLFTVAKSGNLVQKTYSKVWGKDWADLGPTPGGKCTSAPAAALTTTGNLNVFVIGADKKLHQASREGSEWKWSTVGGTCYRGAAAVAHLAQLDVFTVAKSGNLVQKTSSKGWTKDWVDLGATPGGKCISAPSAAVTTAGRFDLFVLGANKQAYQRFSQNGESKWESIGGDCQYGIAVTASPLGRMDIFTVAKSGNLVQKTYSKTWGKDWADLGSPKR